MEPESEVLTDDDKLVKLHNKYINSEIKVIGNEISVGKAKNDIIKDIQIYNTLIIRVYDNEVLSIGVFTNAQPVVYYFKNEYAEDDIEETLNHVEEYCGEHDITFDLKEISLFDD